jgi:hypothetical protein
MGAVSLFAQEGTKAGEGTLMLDTLTIFVKPENGGRSENVYRRSLLGRAVRRRSRPSTNSHLAALLRANQHAG